MAEFQIRDLERVHPATGRNYWTARVVAQSVALNVDTRYGSWQISTDTGRRDLAPHVAAALQAKVRPLEKREQREKDSVM